MSCDFVALTSLDCACYDAYVAQHPKGSAYHFSGWLKSVSDAYGHDSVVALMRNQDGEITGVAPLVIFTRPFGRPYLCALPYCDVGHVLADTPETEALFQDAIAQFAQAKGYQKVLHRDVDIQSNSADDDLSGAKVAMKMPLEATADAQMASYKSKLRSQIRKASKNGLTVTLVQDDSLLDDFYHVIERNMRQLGSPVHKKSWYQAILRHFQGRFCLGVVYSDERPIGAGLILLHPALCSIPWASTLSEYNHLAPNMLLYGELIGAAAQHGCPMFDFGRSTYNEGTFRFKKQWGAEPYPLVWQDWLAVDAPKDSHAHTDSTAKELAIKIWQQLPLPVTTLVGSRVRGMISL
jgi:FemAB-related protein (PEP-CTERM system-associated)